ncbi:MAG TPA: hypothetical protein VII82_11795 [Polyangiaceae bacterium]
MVKVRLRKTCNLAGGTVGLFMDDANKNGKSDLGLPFSGPFIAFTDVFIDATKPAFVTLSLTAGSEDTAIVNNQVVVSNWPSNQGFVSVTFQ